MVMCDFCIICAATQGNFASADATRGQRKQTNVCDRPLDPFGVHSHVSWFSLLKVERACGRCFGIVLANFLCC